MTAVGRAWPSRPPDHLLDLAEWEALPEDDSARYELVEGVMVVSPPPVFRHEDIVFELCRQLRDDLGDGLTALPEVELVVVDGECGNAAGRAPDLVGKHASRIHIAAGRSSRSEVARGPIGSRRSTGTRTLVCGLQWRHARRGQRRATEVGRSAWTSTDVRVAPRIC